MFVWVYEISAQLLSLLRIFSHSIQRWLKPERVASGFVVGLPRHRSGLILENALLRQQLIILRRQIERPQLNYRDPFLLILLAPLTRFWKQTLYIVQQDTLLRWHREMFRLFWWVKSRTLNRKPRVSH